MSVKGKKAPMFWVSMRQLWLFKCAVCGLVWLRTAMGCETKAPQERCARCKAVVKGGL